MGLISALMGQCTVHAMLVSSHLTQHACVTIRVICVLLQFCQSLDELRTELDCTLSSLVLVINACTCLS